MTGILLAHPLGELKRQLCPLNRSFVSVSYLLNQWMDFDQICIYTLLGEWNKLINFGEDLIFMVTQAFWGFCVLSSEPKLK